MRFSGVRRAGIDAGRVGERLAGKPGRRREVAVEVDAGVVLARAGQEAVGVDHRNDRPGRLGAGHALQQAAREQGGDRLLAVLGGGHSPAMGRSPAGVNTRNATPWRERPYSAAVQPSRRLPVTGPTVSARSRARHTVQVCASPRSITSC